MAKRYDDNDLRAIENACLLKCDAGETMFFAEELNAVKAKTYDVKTPANNALMVFPVTSEANPGARTVSFDSYDAVGIAKIITSYADDLPRADVKATRETAKVYHFGISYGYSTQDIREAQMARKPLSSKKAEAARRANDAAVNKMAFYGSKEYGIVGVFNHPNISKYVIENDGEGTSTEWKKKTPEQIIRDLTDSVGSIVEITNGVEIPDTILMPITQYNLISGTLMPDSNGKTIRTFFLENNPYIKNIIAVHEAAGAGSDGKDVMFIYRKDPNALSLEVPLPFEQYAPQAENLEFVVPCESATAGVLVYYPLSACIVEGL